MLNISSSNTHRNMSCACCGLASGTFCILSTLILGTNWKTGLINSRCSWGHYSEKWCTCPGNIIMRYQHWHLSLVSIGIGIGLYSRPLSLARNKYSKNSMGFTAGSVVKNLSAKQRGGSITRSGRSAGAGNGNPLQYSCLGNPTDRRAWWATVHEVT